MVRKNECIGFASLPPTGHVAVGGGKEGCRMSSSSLSLLSGDYNPPAHRTDAEQVEHMICEDFTACACGR